MLNGFKLILGASCAKVYNIDMKQAIIKTVKKTFPNNNGQKKSILVAALEI